MLYRNLWKIRVLYSVQKKFINVVDIMNNRLYIMRPIIDNEFCKKLKNGDQMAWNTMYGQYADMLYAYGMKMVQNRVLVDDCIQDVFVYLYDKRANLPVLHNVQAYLLMCLRNKISRQLIALSKRQSQEINMDSESINKFNLTIDVQETMEHTELREEQLDALQEAIKQLSPRQREILYLRYYKNLGVDDVATVVGISKQTVMNATSVSLAKLRKNELLTRVFLLGLAVLWNL